MTFPYWDRPMSPLALPRSRNGYHGYQGNILKVAHPGTTDLVWSTNFNDEYVDHLVCPMMSSKSGMFARMSGTLKLDKWSTRGIHPEFIFSKPVQRVTINIYEATKFSQLDNGLRNEKGVRIGNKRGRNEVSGYKHMKRHRKLWNATFNLGGGNHILPNAPAPPFRRFCDAPSYNVWDGTNIGKRWAFIIWIFVKILFFFLK